MRVAAIDCGTNSIRLLISDLDERGARDVHREMRTVRLGEGIDTTGEFTAAALERTFAACADYGNLIAAADVASVRFVATSASRDARNREEFVAGVHDLLGVEPEVISGEEEARLTYAGALATHADRIGARSALVVDIGGGSTEFVRGDIDQSVAAACSVDIGCVRMTERHLPGDPPTADEVAAATQDIDANIARAVASVDAGQAQVIVGVAGSVTTVAAMAMHLPKYDADQIDGHMLDGVEISQVAHELLTMTRQQRAGLPFMHRGRIDVIGAGALILARIVDHVPLEVLVSEHDILDGIALSQRAR